MGEGGDDALGRWLTRDRARGLDEQFGASIDTIGVIDRELRLRYISKVAEHLDREALVGQNAALIVPPSEHHSVQDIFTRVLQTGVGETFETTFMHRDRLHLWDVRVGPIRVEGQTIGLTFVTCDVTEQRSMSADRDRFFALSQDMLVVVNPHGLLTRVNPAFTKTLGYDRSELVGKAYADLLHPEDRARTNENFVDVKAGRPAMDFENRYLRKDGRACVFSWRAIVDPITGDTYAVGRDVTDQRRIENELRHAHKMEAVGQLAGGVAHDFNNLLLATLANVELARSQQPSEEIADNLHEIERASQRASELTKQLLAFSRQQPMTPSPVDMNDLVTKILKMLRRLLPESIAISTRLGSELGMVRADPTQLEQVIVNLCVNARDAMEEGGNLTIQTERTVLDRRYNETHPWASPGEYMRLTISDTGAGMAPEVRDRAFEPFFSTKGQKGTGLGLATVYGIVQQHSGVIELRSTLGQGTTCEVYLPLDAADSLAATEKRATPVPHGNETILIAEDEELVRRSFMRVLKRAGYRTLAAENGFEAVRLASHEPGIALAILDLIMPMLGGVETYERLQQLRPGLPVLFASGYADQKYRARLPPDADILEKPFGMDELLRKVREKLDRHSRRERA